MKIKFYSCILLACLPLSHAFAESKNDDTYKKLEAFSKVLGYLEDHYIENLNSSKLVEDALKGMTANLDPHTVYLSADLYRQMKVDTSGEFGGVGMELGLNDQKELIVITPTEDGPALKAGVKSGDRILEINGQSTQGLSLFEAVKKVRGARGTILNLMLQHKDEEKPYDLSLRREVMHIQSVEYRLLPDRVGYIQIKSFQTKTDQEVKRAYNKLAGLASKDGQTMNGLVLDLRNNPGGLLDQAVSVADLFLNEGVIVSTRGRDNAMQSEAKAQVEGTLPYTPMITIMNDGTASAAEIVAGALQDLKRSPLLGTPSFGKGSVQNIIDLDDGSALKITIARYYTPNGRPIQNVGNQPDIYVSDQTPVIEANMIREKDLEGRIDTMDEKGGRGAATEKNKEDEAIRQDPQLKSALDYLKSAGYFQNKETKR